MFIHRCHIIFIYSVVLIFKSIYCNNHSNNEEFKSNATRRSLDTLIKEHVNILIGNDDCDCGPYSDGCDYENQKKVCRCYQGYSQYGDQCRYCDCGVTAQACSYDENKKKICECGVGYSQKGDVCRECSCGMRTTDCMFENGKLKCTCYSGYSQNYNDECERCDCGYGSVKCEFDGFSKKCTCSDGYVEKRGTCESCDCGLNSLSCSFNFAGNRKCVCKKGYFAKIPYSWADDEECRSPDSDVSFNVSGWRIATYVSAGLMLGTIVGLGRYISYKRFQLL